MKINVDDYLESYKLVFSKEYKTFIPELVKLLLKVKNDRRKVYVFGNGASAAIASHVANDLTKAGNIPALTIHDPAILTCFGNDFGYDNWMAKAIDYYAEDRDLVIFISSSGTSKNIVKGVEAAKRNGQHIVLLTGPNPDADSVEAAGLHAAVQSRMYNVIECIHMILLTAAIDAIHPVMLPDAADVTS